MDIFIKLLWLVFTLYSLLLFSESVKLFSRYEKDKEYDREVIALIVLQLLISIFIGIGKTLGA